MTLPMQWIFQSGVGGNLVGARQRSGALHLCAEHLKCSAATNPLQWFKDLRQMVSDSPGFAGLIPVQ